jgi:hypothetical protein
VGRGLLRFSTLILGMAWLEEEEEEGEERSKRKKAEEESEEERRKSKWKNGEGEGEERPNHVALFDIHPRLPPVFFLPLHFIGYYPVLLLSRFFSILPFSFFPLSVSPLVFSDESSVSSKQGKVISATAYRATGSELT